jgi:hypothetical protein
MFFLYLREVCHGAIAGEGGNMTQCASNSASYLFSCIYHASQSDCLLGRAIN